MQREKEKKRKTKNKKKKAKKSLPALSVCKQKVSTLCEK
jgi:hypothetical protein